MQTVTTASVLQMYDTASGRGREKKLTQVAWENGVLTGNYKTTDKSNCSVSHESVGKQLPNCFPCMLRKNKPVEAGRVVGAIVTVSRGEGRVTDRQ